MIRRAVAAFIVLGTVATAPGVAVAMATSQFSIDPAPSARTDESTDRLLVTPKRGGSAHTSVEVINRLDQTLTLRMDVVAVTVQPNGSAVLGGDDTALDWTDLERERVVLAPHASALIDATIRVPRSASENARTVGIRAEPLTDPSAPSPSVVQRLALVVYIRPHGTAPRPVVLIAIAIALAIALAVLGAIVWLAPSLQRHR